MINKLFKLTCIHIIKHVRLIKHENSRAKLTFGLKKHWYLVKSHLWKGAIFGK